MSDLTTRTGLITPESKAALLAFLNSRCPANERFRQMGSRVFHFRGKAVIRTYGGVDEDLNLLALITGAMTPEELNRFCLTLQAAFGVHQAILADAPTRATAAVLALGLEKEGLNA
jgi:hypothetical protein